MTPEERFWGMVEKAPPSTYRPELGPCFVWVGAKKFGYGCFWVNGATRIAHRVAYEWKRGAIPEGLTLDHLCRVRSCVNPDHLDPCTSGENAKRSPNAPYNILARRTHCKRGHEFNEANTSLYQGRRKCRVCDREYQAEKRRSQRKER